MVQVCGSCVTHSNLSYFFGQDYSWVGRKRMDNYRKGSRQRVRGCLVAFPLKQVYSFKYCWGNDHSRVSCRSVTPALDLRCSREG